MSDSKSTPIIAIATGNGNAGIGILRLSGPQKSVTEISSKLFSGKKLESRYAYLLPIHDKDGEIIDRGIVIFFAAPFSYTGESVLEIQVHGGRASLEFIQNELLDRFSDLGLRLANPGEFTERAFLNGKIDLIQAEATADLIEASTLQSVKAASRSLRGDFSKEISKLNDELINLRVEVEAMLDFPEEEIDFINQYGSRDKIESIKKHLEDIIKNAKQGEILRDGLRVAIIGETNVGKSSLLNALAGEEVAIVSDIAGTTRDRIKTSINISGVLFHFVDTAGIRETNDAIEKIGIERSKQEISNADIVLQILDVTSLNDEDHKKLDDLLHTIKKEDVPVIRVFNKSDLLDSSQHSISIVSRETVISTSAVTGAGLQELKNALVKLSGVTDNYSVYSARERHLNLLKAASLHLNQASDFIKSNNPQLELFAEELRESSDNLGEIIGKTTSDDLLGKIFSGFCIGK
ncbi:tRNA uridine-5-carboxymethylaminomethyl(34) synthesis GTPase MnmE [Parasutterella muris]|jgi:tRNA modification GTPase TrmE|uniref:tRNA modification GTPase MnmE n=2 Tax=Parasutterella TaxID=577310 RepID=A0A6L6YJ75_9BURK|nr:tRNA uridine-5-carboxymethylaminomethyl(34) synthesis GTPase MnmE [Parasutterella muris]MVX57697.1 tRNA uridine-5-carboxymethylaminomethyl(34) synthesis GTPase MnmE [Parasutterella muris]